MTRRAGQAKREDSFNLSMVDLFGCGFIAAIFLFILNLLQPHIDAAAAASGVATQTADRGQAGEGTTGPVLISIKSEVPVSFPSWPKGLQIPVATRAFSSEDERFKYIYDLLLPDASVLRWPLQLSVCAKSTPDAEACAPAGAPGGRFDAVVRLTLGYSTMTAYFVRHHAGEVVDVAFDARGALAVSSKRAFERRLEIALHPGRLEATSYRSVSAFFSSEPFVAAAGFAGSVAKIVTVTADKQKESRELTSKQAGCWVFAKPDIAGGEPDIFCPADQARLLALVGSEPWRSDVYVQSSDKCTIPFEGRLCYKPVEPAQVPSEPLDQGSLLLIEKFHPLLGPRFRYCRGTKC